jgi:GlpG protein
MRLIGHLADQNAARTFGDCLYVRGIENQLEHDGSQGWGIWIAEEDKLQEASVLLGAFRANPADPQFKSQARAAENLRAEKEKSEEAYRKRLRGRRHLFRPLRDYRFGPLTFGLICVSAVATFKANWGSDPDSVQAWFICDPFARPSLEALLTMLKSGEVWRLVTPIFLHFGILHIVFNMLWLADLGSMIEGRQGTLTLGLLVLCLAVFSNLIQYFWAGPFFGGMSGVVYGLLGYVWIRGKFDPGSGLYVQPTTVVMMMIWLVAGMLNLIPQVANGAHVGGLIGGVAWGYASSLRHR